MTRRSLGLALALALLAQSALLLAPALAAREPEPAERRGAITIARIKGSINPASSDYLQRAIEESAQRDAAILLIELDTPGGLVTSTQDIIQAMLASRVPIVVYVAPQGAWAGSAGTFISLAAHVAAMAPGTSIGAAHPVEIGGGAPAPGGEGEKAPGPSHAERKAENLLAAFIESIAKKRGRNVEWAEKAVRESVAVTAEQALELKVIDLVARDRAELLEKLEGRVVETDSGPVRLALAGASEHEIEMGIVTRVLDVIADPNVVAILFMAGLALLYLEFSQPGLIVPGVLGAGCLVLALIAVQILPFSWMGVMLVLLGAGLLVAEVFVTSFGLLFAGGLACLLTLLAVGTASGDPRRPDPDTRDATRPARAAVFRAPGFPTVDVPAIADATLDEALAGLPAETLSSAAQLVKEGDLGHRQGSDRRPCLTSRKAMLAWRMDSEGPFGARRCQAG